MRVCTLCRAKPMDSGTERRDATCMYLDNDTYEEGKRKKRLFILDIVKRCGQETRRGFEWESRDN